MVSTVTYEARGLTCPRCMVTVMDQIRTLPGVKRVRVDLVQGGASPVIVTAEPAVAAETIRQRVQKAGFHMSKDETENDVDDSS